MTYRSGPTMRDRIVAASLELFALRGFDGTVMGDIAEYLDVTPEVIAQHFPDKEAILRDILSPALRRIDQILDRHDATDTVSDPGALVAELIDAIADSGPQVVALLDDPAAGARVHTSASDSALTARIELVLARELARVVPDATVPRSVARTERRIRAACAVAAIPAGIAAWQESNQAAAVIDREARQTLVDVVLAIVLPPGQRHMAP